MVKVKLTNREFARIVTAMHDAANLLEESYSDDDVRDEVRSQLRCALELLMIEEGKDAGVV